MQKSRIFSPKLKDEPFEKINVLAQLWTTGILQEVLRTNKLESLERDLDRARERLVTAKRQVEWAKEWIEEVKINIEREKEVIKDKELHKGYA